MFSGCSIRIVRTVQKLRRVALLIVVVALLAVLFSPVVSAQTVADIESRDTLIANQEALLNVYRCMFDVDTEIVPGGCTDGKPALSAEVPEPFAGTPTAGEQAGRDKLIGDQESLLNVYRCLFDIDTGIVPGGCVAGKPYPTFTAQPPPDAYAFSAVDAGLWHTCAIHNDKTTEFLNIICWGHDGTGQAQPPIGQFTEIAGGGGYSCAIRDDRTITCWGQGEQGQTDAPEGEFTAIASGLDHSCAIRDDQTIACWGDNELGKADAPEGRFTDIAAGNNHSCAIRDDQTIACWGSNEQRQTDAPEGQYREIVGKGWHSCAIRDDWTIACWGWNGDGQTDTPEGHYAKIATADSHSCAIRNDGTIACWGNNSEGQTDAPDGQFTEITAARDHTCAIRTDQTITCWGQNQFGQTNAPLGLLPIQAVYAVPSDVEPVRGRERAIAHEVTVVQEWFQSQTNGTHPIFERDNSSISVKTVKLAHTVSELPESRQEVANVIREALGAAEDNPLLIFLESKVNTMACGWGSFNSHAVIPIENCSIAPMYGSFWPAGATYLIAHELAHLLGAVRTCPPNHDENTPSHTNDSRRDLLYSGSSCSAHRGC